MSKTHLALTQVSALIAHCLRANGCDPTNANAVAANMTSAERDGCAGHGLIRLPGYVAALRSGKVDGKARPDVERVAPGAIKVDANGGFAPLALELSRAPLIEAARENGIAMMGLVRVHHFSALWAETESIAKAGLCAFACTAYMPAMPPAGGSVPFFGTNPLAFAWPRGDDEPMVFDMATAAMAKGEVMVAAREGHELPPGVGLNADGEPTTNPKEILDGGMLLPFGGYKGSGISMMVELLAGGMLGEHFSYEAAKHDNKDGGPARGGEFILAMDPSRIAGPDWLAHSEDFFENLLAIEGTRLPGMRRIENRARYTEEGIDTPTELYEKIVALCDGDET